MSLYLWMCDLHVTQFHFTGPITGVFKNFSVLIYITCESVTILLQGQ
jgi:hypothetical protein